MSNSFLTLWTVACQVPLSMGILQARVLEWVAMSFSRGSSRPRDQSCISCLAGRFFTTEPPGKPTVSLSQTCHASWSPMSSNIILVGSHSLRVSCLFYEIQPKGCLPSEALPAPCPPHNITSSEPLFDALEVPKNIYSILFKFCVYSSRLWLGWLWLGKDEVLFNFAPRVAFQGLTLECLWVNEGGCEWTKCGKIRGYGKTHIPQSVGKRILQL